MMMISTLLLDRCCVHNMSPFISSSGFCLGSREAKVQRDKVCSNIVDCVLTTRFGLLQLHGARCG